MLFTCYVSKQQKFPLFYFYIGFYHNPFYCIPSLHMFVVILSNRFIINVLMMTINVLNIKLLVIDVSVQFPTECIAALV